MSMIPLDSSSTVSLRQGRRWRRPRTGRRRTCATTPRAPSEIRYATIRATWLLLPGSSWIRMFPCLSIARLSILLSFTPSFGRLRAVEEQGERRAGVRVLDVVPAQAPEAAGVERVEARLPVG